MIMWYPRIGYETVERMLDTMNNGRLKWIMIL